jgi:hypothetical protein
MQLGELTVIFNNIGTYAWGTHCVILSDGSSWGTQGYYPGGDCWYNTELPVVEYNLNGYIPRTCNRRILLIKKTFDVGKSKCSLEQCLPLKGRACKLAARKLGCSCQLTGKTKAGMATVTDPKAIGYYTFQYKTLDEVDPTDPTSGCQTSALRVPAGWQVSSTWGTLDPRSAAALYNWGTDCLIVMNGPNGYQGWGSKQSGPKQSCTDSDLVQTDSTTQGLKVAKCNRRILLQKNDLGFKCLPG